MKKSFLLLMLLALMLVLHGCTISGSALNQKVRLVSSKEEAIDFFIQAVENWKVVGVDLSTEEKKSFYYDSSEKKFYEETYYLNEDNEKIVTDYVFCSNDVLYHYTNNQGDVRYFTEHSSYRGFSHQSLSLLRGIKQQLDEVTYTKYGTTLIVEFTAPLGDINVDMTFTYKGDSKIYVDYQDTFKEVVYEASDDSLDEIYDSISYHFDDDINK